MLKRLSVVTGRHAACRPQQRGAVAVEFALVLPILVMLLLGTVTAGVAYSRCGGSDQRRSRRSTIRRDNLERRKLGDNGCWAH